MSDSHFDLHYLYSSIMIILSRHRFDTNRILNQAVQEFIYGKYNHVRPRSANGGLTAYVARCVV
jgi:hypothetical protein